MQYPYIKKHGIDDLRFKFFNEEATAWYDPLKPYTLLEYRWVRDNVPLSGQSVVDAGCHHGNYSIVFKGAVYICAFDMNAENCYYAIENMILNKLQYISTVKKMNISSKKPASMYSFMLPSVYKMDIEGDEFEVLPVEIEQNPQVHTWIIEIHPKHGEPDIIAGLFKGFELLKVDREQMKVRPYSLGETWPTHATLIARR